MLMLFYLDHDLQQQLLIYLDNGYGIGGSAIHLAAAGGIVRCSEVLD